MNNLIITGALMSNYPGSFSSFQRPFACGIGGCSKSYSRQAHLKRHQQTHKVQDNESSSRRPRKVFRCPVANCNSVTFNRKWDLRLHLFAHGLADGYKCDRCSAQFATRQKLDRHVAYHEKVYVCELDGTKFETWSALRKHKSVVHRKLKIASSSSRAQVGAVELFRCAVGTCERVYYHKRNLDAHQRKHHAAVLTFDPVNSAALANTNVSEN